MSAAAPQTKTYYIIFGGLLLLTIVTVGAAYIDLGFLSQPVALAIAFTKATLVMIYFMHLNHSSTLVRIFAGSGVAWLIILLMYTIADYVTRQGIAP